MPTTTTTEQTDRASEAAQDLVTVGAQFVAACEALHPLAERLAALEAQHRAATSAAGHACTCVPVRSAAADVALAALEPLRPYTRFTTQEAGERAVRYLTTPCRCVPAGRQTRRIDR